MDVKKAISEIKSGKVEYRLDKTNIIHLGFGKVSFGTEKLLENYETVMEAINKAGYIPGKDICIALDVAASELYNKENKTYVRYCLESALWKGLYYTRI